MKGALGVAAVGAAVAAGTRRKHRSALAGDIEAIRSQQSLVPTLLLAANSRKPQSPSASVQVQLP